MFKEENQIWLYLVGIIVMFIILVFVTINYMIPIIFGGGNFDEDGLFEQAPEFTIETDFDYTGTIETTEGTIEFDLYESAAPINVNNFVYLSEENYYDGTEFYRIIPGVLFQGGTRATRNNNPADDATGGPGYIIDDEINWDSLNLSNSKRNQLISEGYTSTPNLSSRPVERYSIAMANGGPDTNGSQFFIVFGNSDDDRTQYLNGRFTVIGKVTNGFDTVNTIANSIIVDRASSIARPENPVQVREININMPPTEDTN